MCFTFSAKCGPSTVINLGMKLNRYYTISILLLLYACFRVYVSTCLLAQSSSGQCSQCEWVMMKPLVVLTFSYLKELPWLLHHTLHNLCLCLSTPAYNERAGRQHTQTYTHLQTRTTQCKTRAVCSAVIEFISVGADEWHHSCFDTQCLAEMKGRFLDYWLCWSGLRAKLTIPPLPCQPFLSLHCPLSPFSWKPIPLLAPSTLQSSLWPLGTDQ